MPGRWSATAKLDHFWLEFFAPIPRLGGAKDDESLKVFGRPEGIHSEAGQRRGSGRGDLPQGRDRLGDLFQYDGLLPTEMRRLKQLEDENAKLKKLVADLSLDKDMLQDVIRRKL